VGIADRRVGTDVVVENVRGLLRHGDEILRILIGNGMVESIGGGNRVDENQHDEARAFLSIVGAVEKADPRAGKNQQAANVERGRLGALGSLIKLGVAK
jgi:hypothetical protein